MSDKIHVSVDTATAVAEELCGSASSIADILYNCFGIEEEEIENWKEFYAIIDNITFECVCCGWWCEVGYWSMEHTDENVCLDCEEEY